jgi:hypothetical protein
MEIHHIEIYDRSSRRKTIGVPVYAWMDQVDADAAAAEAVTRWASENGLAYDDLDWAWVAHVPINFSPFATNVLTWVDRDGLITPDGRPVKITRASRGCAFIISVDNQVVGWANDNVGASFLLNQRNVGRQQRPQVA